MKTPIVNMYAGIKSAQQDKRTVARALAACSRLLVADLGPIALVHSRAWSNWYLEPQEDVARSILDVSLFWVGCTGEYDRADYYCALLSPKHEQPGGTRRPTYVFRLDDCGHISVERAPISHYLRRATSTLHHIMEYQL